MEMDPAVARLAALAHATRLQVFRVLMSAAPGGVRAGHLAARLGVSPSNLTAHLNTLAQAGLVHATADGRTKIYRVDVTATTELLGFIVSDCCHGHPDVCAALAEAATPCAEAAPAPGALQRGTAA